MSDSHHDNYKTLQYDVDRDGILTLAIHRPDKMNALNREVLKELDHVFSSLEKKREVRAVVLTGSGTKAFVAGADIGELSELNRSTGEDFSEKGQAAFSKIEELSKPVVAAVNGYALGGGAELALACHLRIAAENAVFGFPEVSLGLIPGYGGTQRLTRIIGRSAALELILTGRHIKAAEAVDYGLFSRAVSAGEAVTEAKKLLNSMLKNAPLALVNAIQVINHASSGSPSGYRKEAELFGKLCETEDFEEGTRAFLEKRKADFKGR